MCKSRNVYTGYSGNKQLINLGNIITISSATLPFGYRHRYFDQVGHKSTSVSSENKHFFSKYCHCQTHQNYEQSLQKLGTTLEIFDQFLTQKNDFESTNFELFEEVVHDFGKSDEDIIQRKNAYFHQMHTLFHFQLDQKILDGLQPRRRDIIIILIITAS